MSNLKARAVTTIALCGFFLFIDRILKFSAFLDLRTSAFSITDHGFYYPFKNGGIAFSVPLPNLIIILFSFVIIGVLTYLFIKNRSFLSRLSLTLILLGALSNLFDRVYFGFTIDYLLIWSIVINISDIMIAMGFVMYVFYLNKHAVS